MSGPEITVGLSISLSGRFQLQGQQALHGYLLWQSYTNGLGGIAIPNGEKITVRLIWHDDRSQISWAQNNVLRLLQQDRIDILFGPYSSSLTMAVAGIAEEYKKVLWNSGGTSDEIFAHGWRYLVGVASPASHYPRKLPRWLAEQYPALVRICVLYSGKETFGWRVARGPPAMIPQRYSLREHFPLQMASPDPPVHLERPKTCLVLFSPNCQHNPPVSPFVI